MESLSLFFVFCSDLSFPRAALFQEEIDSTLPVLILFILYIYDTLFFRFFFFLLLQTPVMFQTVRARRQGFYIFPSFFLSSLVLLRLFLLPS